MSGHFTVKRAAGLLAALALIASPAVAKTSVVGVYQIRQIEMAGGLELKPNGRFRYAFSYGALDEESSGTWTFDGKTVLLTSNPMPKPPEFELVRDDPAPSGQLWMTLENPGFDWGEPLHALATSDMKSTFEIEAGEDGRVDLSGKPPVAALSPLIPVFGPTPGVFKLSPDRGHRLSFRFHKNDLGQAAFKREPLEFRDGELVLKRYDSEIRFLRVRP
jgi:hypothetical protein